MCTFDIDTGVCPGGRHPIGPTFWTLLEQGLGTNRVQRIKKKKLMRWGREGVKCGAKVWSPPVTGCAVQRLRCQSHKSQGVYYYMGP